MRHRLLALAFAGFAAFPAGCRSHVHAGGGQGFDAGAAIGPRHAYTPPPEVIQLPPPSPAVLTPLPSR